MHAHTHLNVYTNMQVRLRVHYGAVVALVYLHERPDT